MVGVISLMMAYKSLFSNTFIPFHEEAAGTSLDKLDDKVHRVILTLMKTTGLGFLVVALLLLVFPIINFFQPSPLIQYGIPLISALYCVGLYVVNYRLYKQTKASTPWKASLFAAIILVIGLIVSLI
jgi:FtsH-binding integral membrane protein